MRKQLYFHCDPDHYAPDYVQAMVNSANACLANPTQDMWGTSPQLPDTRIRFEPFGNPANLCNVIFFHETAPTSFSNGNALHVIIIDQGNNCSIGGEQPFGSNITYLYNWHCAVFGNGWNENDIALWGPSFAHELGHRFGLCHSFSAENSCPDLNPVADCGGPSSLECVLPNDITIACPTVPPNTAYDGSGGCGGNDCFACYCTYGSGNNLMGANTGGDECGLTKAQWAQYYGAMLEERPAFVRFDVDCDNPPGLASLEITGPTPVEWDGLILLAGDVTVKTGATLIINCEVWMARDKSIFVERGARLFVYGKITSWDPDCRWLGIC